MLKNMVLIFIMVVACQACSGQRAPYYMVDGRPTESAPLNTQKDPVVAATVMLDSANSH